MKYFPRIIAFIILVVAWFYLGMQWWNSVRPAPRQVMNDTPSRPIVPIIVPAAEEAQEVPQTVPVEEIVAEPSKPENTLPETAPKPVSVSTVVDANLPKKISETMNHYSNSNFRYEFDIPANVYYSGFNGENGARHTVGIGKEDPSTLADAAIRVYFYGKKVLPELQNAPNGRVEDPAGAYVYLLLDGAYSVKIEALNINHPIVQKIIESIKVF